ncbi:hypothetical protein CFD26_100879 [Aspergillus turcosus]|uniref:Thioredoxin domain-containing protein n=1 Tax=Aspergillus turcosus TaxID=1245748 RepID=A0A3R7FSP6_9EURO|nr:hypothetical protein CFD26_100879 [Aspergillus turcosus]
MVAEIRSKGEFDTGIAVDRLGVYSAFVEMSPDWQEVAVTVEMFSEQYTDAHFEKFDIDKVPVLAQELSVRVVPTFFLYKGGKFLHRVDGASPSALEEAIQKYI